MRRIAVKVRDTIATVTGSALFPQMTKHLPKSTNCWLMTGRKIVIIACIELDATDDKERKAQMSVWMQKLKQKLSWLHAVKISINPVDNITALLPDTEVLIHINTYCTTRGYQKTLFSTFQKSTAFVSVLIQRIYLHITDQTVCLCAK